MGSRKRRALFLFPTDIMGGAENVIRMMAKSALQSGRFDEIILFVLCKGSHGTLDELSSDQRVQLVYASAKTEKGGLFALTRQLAKGRYDFVFSSHTHLNAAASLARKVGLLRTDRLVTRESTMIFEREMGFRGNLARKLYSVYGAQDLIVCQTQRMTDSLNANTNNRFADRVKTIGNPIDLNAACLNTSKNRSDAETNMFRIAWCGRLAAVKSPLRALDTLALLHKNGRSNAHLIMIGDGPLRRDIEAHAATLGLSDFVKLTGRVDHPSTIMKTCHAGLMTSDVEGFPNVILEMLASGIARVITTDCAGGLAELPGVKVAAKATPEALAALLAAIPDNATPDEEIEPFLRERTPDRFLQRLLAA